jgi:hypothetical protein
VPDEIVAECEITECGFTNTAGRLPGMDAAISQNVVFGSRRFFSQAQCL